jgi:uncharacterized phage infection (PIP) family protein YhgE
VTILFASATGDFILDHWHWIVVAVVGTLFFLLQVCLCIGFYRRMRRHQRTLVRLYQDVQNGGDGRPDIEVFAARFPWLKWVHHVFPAGTTIPGNYTRDDVLHELDTRIASSSDYLFLQRMGVMAPLLGVILTVLGFGGLDVSKTKELGQILAAVTPLVAGVGTGAVLAFINQALLHLANVKSEALRMAARTWFDAAIWSSVGLDTQAATVKAVAGVEKMAQTVSESADKQKESAQWLADSTLAIQEAATEFCTIVQELGGGVQELPEQLSGVRVAMQSSVETIQSLIPVAERVVAGLDVSVSAFRTAVESQFIEAARLHRTAIGDVSESAERLSRTSEHLQAGSETLHGAITSHNSSFEELGRALTHSLEYELVPTHQKLREAVTSFDTHVGDFSSCMRSLRSTTEALSDNIHSATHDIGSLSGELAPAVVAFRSAIDDGFTAATRQHENNLKALAVSVEQIQQGGQSLTKGASAIEHLLERHTGLDAQIEPAHEALRLAMDQIAAAGGTLKQSIEGQLAPSQQAMGAAADSFAASATRLTEFIDKGIVPATERLATLDETMSRLEGTVNAIRDFSGVREEMEHLTQSLAKAAAVTQAIETLPDQIRRILEELVANQQQEVANSRGKWTGWLKSRPRT